MTGDKDSTGNGAGKENAVERLNEHLAVCPFCEAPTSDEVVAIYSGEIDGEPVETRVLAIICPFCGYLDSWAESPEDEGFKKKYDSYRPNEVV